jgi:uncharacterized Zn finger protein
MKVKEGFILRKMGGQPVVVAVGSASKTFNGMVKLNETGEFLWQHMTENVSESDLVQALLENYDVPEEIAKKDVETFINTLKTPGIVE